MVLRTPTIPRAVSVAVSRRLPDAGVNDAVVIGEGIATRAYRVQDSSGAWVVRVSNDYPQPWTWRGGRRYEVPLLRALAARGVRVPGDPSVLVAAPGGLPVAILEREVAGSPVTLPLRGHVRQRWARQLADFLTALHSFPAADAAAFGVPITQIDQEYRDALTEAAPFVGSKTRHWLDRQITDLEQRSFAQIDFGDTTIADPALDFAKISDELGTPFLRLLLRQYQGPDTGALFARIQLHRRLQPLFEAADPDGWGGDRPSAIRRLTASAAVSARQARTSPL